MNKSEHKRNCPKCNRELIYSTIKNFKDANKNNSLCRSCCISSSKFKTGYTPINKGIVKSKFDAHIKKYKNVKRFIEYKYGMDIEQYYKLKEIKLNNSIIRKTKNNTCKNNIRKCPSCNGDIHHYCTDIQFKYNIKCNNVCRKCADKSKGKKISDRLIDHYKCDNNKKNLSILIKKAMHRPDVRKKHIDALNQSKWLKVKTDKGQLELLEKWNRLGFNFEPNYQIKTDTDLFYIDGYDPIHNVVLEYDSKYHNRLQQKEKDLNRQQSIIKAISPKKFWRYDAVNKQYRNIV